MEEKIVDLQINKIIQEYTYLKTDEELKKELINVKQSEFLKMINDELSKIDKEKLKPQQNVSNVDVDSKPKAKIENLSDNDMVKMKKIYREIVKLTHPDKVSDEELNQIYQDSIIAYESNDLFELYFIAKSLKIHFKLTLEETKILNELIDFKKKEIQTIEKSFVWRWLSTNNEKEKLNIITQFIKVHYLA